MAADGPLFISYSRRDYYFAESLAHHLIERGVAAFLVTMVLVFLRMRPAIAFWFPASGAAWAARDGTLNAGRNWQTLIWTCVYLLAWGLVFRIQ